MTKEREALKLALDWLEEGNFVYPTSLRTAIKEALAQPEPVTSGWSLRYVYFDENGIPLAHREPEERNFCPRCGKRTADLTTIHTCTPPYDNALQRGLARTKEAVAASQAFYRSHKSSVSTPNAGGKCVTDGETAPKEST